MIGVDEGRLCAARVRVMAMAVINLLQLAMCIRTFCAQDSDPSDGSLAHPTWAEAMGFPCWRSCITYPAVVLASEAFRAATKPSVLKESVMPAGMMRSANFVVPSSSPRELVTDCACRGSITWASAAA
jgi:hypothetical protein